MTIGSKSKQKKCKKLAREVKIKLLTTIFEEMFEFKTKIHNKMLNKF